jgi:hypothetical protein
MTGKRDPWVKLATLAFEQRKDLNGPEAKKLIKHIENGYARTSKRVHYARDDERTVLLAAFPDLLKPTTRLDQQFLRECITVLKSKGFRRPYSGTWTVNAVRQIIKKARAVKRPPSRPFYEPAPPPHDYGED